MSIEDLSVDKYIKINELKLQDELAMCASYYYTFASLEIEAEDIYEKATLQLEIYEGQLVKKVKAEHPELVKATQKTIETYYREDPQWQELRKGQLKKQFDFKMLHKGASALEMKSKMLMSMNRRDLFGQDKGFGRKRNEEE